MMDLVRVVNEIKAGRLVEMRFLTKRGRETGSTGDHPCADARFKGERFAYFPAFGSCAHALDVKRVEDEGDEVYLHGRMGETRVRLRISPVWLDEQREILAAWKREKDAVFVQREFERAIA